MAPSAKSDGIQNKLNYLIKTNQEAEEVTFCKVLTVFPIFFFQGHMMSNAGSFISCQELIRSGYLLT